MKSKKNITIDPSLFFISITVHQVISYDNLDNKRSVPTDRINEIRFVVNLTAIIF